MPKLGVILASCRHKRGQPWTLWFHLYLSSSTRYHTCSCPCSITFVNCLAATVLTKAYYPFLICGGRLCPNVSSQKPHYGGFHYCFENWTAVKKIQNLHCLCCFMEMFAIFRCFVFRHWSPRLLHVPPCHPLIGCGNEEDSTTKTAISLKWHKSCKWKFPQLLRT